MDLLDLELSALYVRRDNYKNCVYGRNKQRKSVSGRVSGT